MAGFDPIGSVNVAPLGLQNPRPVFMGTGLGALFQALAQRDQEGRAIEEMKQEMVRRDQEMKFRQQQEARLREFQQGQLQIDRDRLTAEQRQKGASALTEAYAKNPKAVPFVAQAYGGKVEDVMAPPGPALAGIDEDPSAEPVSQGFQPTGKQRLTMPGMDPFDLPAPEADPDHYARLDEVLGRMPGAPAQLERLRLAEARAAGLDPRQTISHIEDQRQRDFQAEQGRLNRSNQARLARERPDPNDRSNQKLLGALKYQAGVADQELAKIEAAIVRNKGVPVIGAEADEYGKAVDRATAALGVVESGNPTAEVSDPTKQRIKGRIGTGSVGAAVSAIPGIGRFGPGDQERALAKVREERAALRRRISEFEASHGMPSSGPAVGGSREERMRRAGF